MDPAKYEYQSEWVREWLAQGRLEGRADLLARQLTLRFGELDEESAARIASAPIEELDAIGERLLTAASLEEVLGGR